MSRQDHPAAAGQRFETPNSIFSLPNHPSLSICIFKSRQSLLTSSNSSREDVRNAQSWQTLVERVHDSTPGGPASTKSGNVGNDREAYRSAPAETGQEHPTSASTPSSSRDQCRPCPFHGPILDMSSAHRSQGQGLDPMGRFLTEGPSEQHALFIRADTGALSTSRGCTCRAAMAGRSR